MLKIDNTWRMPKLGSCCDFSNPIAEHFHLVRKDEAVQVVSDGFVDCQKLVDSEAKNAGLVNILKLQELRYGTLENAIARNVDKQVFADVSNIPTNVAEQAEYIAKVQAEIEALKAKLGLSQDELLKLNEDKYNSLTSQDNNNGGQE